MIEYKVSHLIIFHKTHIQKFPILLNCDMICQLPVIICNPINSWQHENMSNVDGSAAINSVVHSTKENIFETTKRFSSLPGCSQQILNGHFTAPCDVFWRYSVC